MTGKLLRTRTTHHHPFLRLAFGQTEEEKKGSGFIGSHPVIAPLAQGQMVAGEPFTE